MRIHVIVSSFILFYLFFFIILDMFSEKLLKTMLYVFISRFMFKYKMAPRISCPLGILIFLVASVFGAWHDTGLSWGSQFLAWHLPSGKIGCSWPSQSKWPASLFPVVFAFPLNVLYLDKCIFWCGFLPAQMFGGVEFLCPYHWVGQLVEALFSSQDWVVRAVDSGWIVIPFLQAVCYFVFVWVCPRCLLCLWIAVDARLRCV